MQSLRTAMIQKKKHICEIIKKSKKVTKYTKKQNNRLRQNLLTKQIQRGIYERKNRGSTVSGTGSNITVNCEKLKDPTYMVIGFNNFFTTFNEKIKQSTDI